MKKSIIYLGIALVSLSNVCNASNALGSEKLILNQDNTAYLESKKIPAVVDETYFNPENVIPMNYENAIEETIAENNKIIENKAIENNDFLYIEKPIEEIIASDNQLIESIINNDMEPIYIEKSIEEVIKADNQLIESDFSNEVHLLDFEKINKSTESFKNISNKKIIGMN